MKPASSDNTIASVNSLRFFIEIALYKDVKKPPYDPITYTKTVAETVCWRTFADYVFVGWKGTSLVVGRFIARHTEIDPPAVRHLVFI